MTGKISRYKIAFIALLLFATIGSGLIVINHYQTPSTLYILEKNPPLPASVIPELPDLSRFTTAQMETLIPKLEPGTVDWQLLWDSPEFKDLQIKEDVDFVANRQDNDDPFWIVIRTGVYDLDSLYQALNDDTVMQKMPDGYLIKAPLLIGRNANLILKNQKFYLSTHDGGMVTSYGGFYALNATITSWDTITNTHTIYDAEQNSFRPYLQFLNDSTTYIAGSRLEHLGYNSSKGFGLSFSANTNVLPNPSSHTPVSMTGWVVDSTISDLYYGYYTYMASTLVVVGNTFKNNIIYGIDPHDYSSHLIIAKNNVSGTKKKHGIIISRYVNNSYIFENTTYKNKGSGIMLDRQCSENIVAFNNSHHNGADGLFFSESSNNISYKNILNKNDRSGLRLRNSSGIVSVQDQIFENKRAGIILYNADLSGTDRDLLIDPYEQNTKATIIETTLSGNVPSHINLESFNSVDFYNLSVIKTPAGRIFTLPDHFMIPPFQSFVSDPTISVRLQYKESSKK